MPSRVKSNIKYAREAVPFDKGSILLIQELHPDIRHDAFELATSCWNIGIPLRVYRTRTTKMEQDFLYEFGRTVPGSFYTTSRGGSSLEEMGFVMNVGIVSFENDTWISYEEVLPSNQHRRLHWFWWRHVIHEFKQRGWLWCNSKPLPLFDKFQKTFGYLHGELSILKHIYSDQPYVPLDQDRIKQYESVHNRRSKIYKQNNNKEDDISTQGRRF